MTNITLLNGRVLKVADTEYLGCKRLSAFVADMKQESERKTRLQLLKEASEDFCFGEQAHLIDVRVKRYLYDRYIRG